MIRRHLLPIAVLVALPLLANLFLILGVVQADPAYWFSYLAVGARPGWFDAAPSWFDPPIGLITEAQGHLAALDWLHGTVPWWDPYTGIGMPLAAEMQTLALFPPFVLLLALPHGWLALRVILQMLSGLSLYALLTSMETTRLAALVAGALFGFCGLFFMAPQAAAPLPFLPLLLLGIETAWRAAQARAPRGWGCIAIATGSLVYAGFPEIAYFGGLLALVWAAIRFASLGPMRWRFAGKLALGGGIGLIASLPLLVPFLHYVAHAFGGPHDGFFASLSMVRPGDGVALLPFMFGPISSNLPASVPAGIAAEMGSAWAQTGTWFGPVAVVGALMVVGRQGRFRALGIGLAAFIGIGALRIVGFPGVAWVLNLIPEVARADTIRFVSPAMQLALLILLGLAIDHWQRHGPPPSRVTAAAGLLVALLVVADVAANAAPIVAWYRAEPALIRFGIIGCTIDLAAAAVLLVVLGQGPGRRSAALLATVVIGDAVLGFSSGQLSAVRGARLDLGGVRWLQAHQGLSRMFTTLPFGPNYPASYRVAAINANQLPVDLGWMRYLIRRLDNGALFVSPAQAARNVAAHPSAYEAVGVRYVVTLPGSDPFGGLPSLGATDQAIALADNASLQGVVPASLVPARPITGASIRIGTYHGASRGALGLTICAGMRCGRGEAALAGAPDDQYLRIGLDHKVPVAPGVNLTFTLRHIAPRASHDAGADSFAIWAASVPHGGLPDLRLITGSAGPTPLVFSNRVMQIYRLADPAPIFSAPGCRLAPAGWNRVRADCRVPSRLIRRVAWFAGWRATVDGRPVAVQRHGALFQAIDLPAGRSTVGFFYRPRGTRLDVALALCALLLGLGLYRFGRRAGRIYREV